MTLKIGVRELARNSSILSGHDYVDVEDKKTHEYKGVFVSAKYAEEIKVFLEGIIATKKKKRLDAIMQFSGFSDGEFGDIDIQELTISKRKKYDAK